MGGDGWFESNYRVTPTWVEFGLDWVRLGCRLGWVVTINLSLSPKDTQRVMTLREQFNHLDHDSNPSKTMTLTACPVGHMP